jgi:hypothetical protein
MSATIEYRRAARGWRSPVRPVHAVASGDRAAVCGARPAGGWSIVPPEAPHGPTCPACRKKLGMGPLPAPRAEGGAR